MSTDLYKGSCSIRLLVNMGEGCNYIILFYDINLPCNRYAKCGHCIAVGNMHEYAEFIVILIVQRRVISICNSPDANAYDIKLCSKIISNSRRTSSAGKGKASIGALSGLDECLDACLAYVQHFPNAKAGDVNAEGRRREAGCNKNSNN